MIERKILNLVNPRDYEEGLIYDEDAIYAYDSYTDILGRHFDYSVRNENSYIEHEVSIVKNKDVIKGTCDCAIFKKTHSCKHLAACYICYSDEIFYQESKKNIELKSKIFLEKLKKDSYYNKETIKKKINLICSFDLELLQTSSYIGKNRIYLRVRLGEDKLYYIHSKFSNFLKALRNNMPFKLSDTFTFEPEKYVFTKEQEELIDFLEDYFNMGGRNVPLSDKLLKRYIRLSKGHIIMEKNLEEKTIKNNFFKPIMEKENNFYSIQFNCDFNDVFYLTKDGEYIFYDNEIYELNKEEQELLKKLKEENLSNIIFKDEELSLFKTYFLPSIRKGLTILPSVETLVIPKKKEAKLYFDVKQNKVIGKLVFCYDNKEYLYKVKDDDVILFDKEFENIVINKLYSYGFINKDNEFILDKMEDIIKFIKEGLNSLNKEYVVYTTEKVKKIKIVEKANITSMFHLDLDKVFHYEIKIDELKEKEIEEVLAALKKKVKYYRLKDGTIYDLESTSFESILDLEDKLNTSINVKGIIPKFKAFYLQSINNNIIKTDDNFKKWLENFNKKKKEKVNFTKEENNLLREYQKEGVNFLYSMYNCEFGAILADEMGLGKSLETLTFLKKTIKAKDKVLIVCPTSLIYNWEEEIKKFAKDLSYSLIVGNKNKRRKSLEKFKGNIFITSYGLLKEDIDFYKKYNFSIMIIDEAQAIKNPTSLISKRVKEIKSKVKFALTGTPIENSIIELWSIFDYILPGFLGSLTSFKQNYLTNEDTILENLKKQIHPFILRRKKNDVLKELPEKLENNIYIDLSDEQKALYTKEVKLAKEIIRKEIKQKGFDQNKLIILSILTRLRQLCISPKLLYENYTGSSIKIEELIKIVNELINNGHKIVLFTSFKTALHLIEKEFIKEKISYYKITGEVSAKNRMKYVKDFNIDDTNVFLIMLKSGGTGLNLTGADVVIHFDLWWNPQAENQATDRTHRIGQTHVVHVIKLICKNTIEERILELQEKKKHLINLLIDQGRLEKNIIETLTEEDIYELLRFDKEE